MSTDLVAGCRSVRQVIADCRTLVEPALRDAVDALPASLRQAAGYHFGWCDERGDPAGTGGGKALRPALTLLAAEAVGAEPESAVPAAAAVELVHNSSLIHDDLIDGDATRRHRPTVWRVFGRPAAILTGDALLIRALEVVADTGHPAARRATRILTAAALDLLDGQSGDVGFECRTDVGLDECLGMVGAKTASLLGAACRLGGLYGNGRPRQIAQLGGFGYRLGMAFQHVDDLLGIWGDPSVTGKPTGSDLRSRKKSLPVVAALASGTAAGRELQALYHGRRPLTGSDVVRAAELVDLAGGSAWSRAQAAELLARARDHLAALPSPRAALELTSIAELIVRRDH